MKTLLTIAIILAMSFFATAQIQVTVNDGDLTNITWSQTPTRIVVNPTFVDNVNATLLPTCGLVGVEPPCTDITYNYPLQLIDPTTSGLVRVASIGKGFQEVYEFTVLPVAQDNSCGENKVYVCHVKGNGDVITICVNEAAVDAHISHGDSLGECD